MSGLNIADAIASRAVAARPAIVSGARTVSYGELLAEAGACAGWLEACLGDRRCGAVPRVGLACANGLDYITMALGMLRAEICLVPVPDELTPAEIEDLATRTALHGMVRMEHGKRSWHSRQCRDADFSEADFAALNPAFIRFSFGTTGASKGVVLSHERLVGRIEAANEGLRIGPGDRVLWILPMAHHFAVSIVLYLYHGACTVLADSHLGEAIVETANHTQATVVYGSPFHFAMLAADRSGFMWPSLRLAVSTAAALPAATADAFQDRLGRPLVQGLGVIEVGLPLLNLRSATTHPTALGDPLPRYEVEIRDDAGHSLGAGAVGELCVRGPGFFDAYLSPWRPCAEVCADGWFATGDLVERDESGRVHLRGRRKSVLNVSGMKVFPEEIERVLDAHPGVARSRAFGREHPVFGTVPVAEVVAASATAPPTPPELTRHCRAMLSTFKVPVKIALVAAIDTTASGKNRRY